MSYKAKGLLPESHELALGGAGLSPKADKLLLPFLAEADCIVLAGYDPIEMRINWRDPFPPNVPVIELLRSAPCIRCIAPITFCLEISRAIWRLCPRIWPQAG